MRRALFLVLLVLVVGFFVTSQKVEAIQCVSAGYWSCRSGDCWAGPDNGCSGDCHGQFGYYTQCGQGLGWINGGRCGCCSSWETEVLNCPACHTDSGYCGNNWCAPNAPAPQICPTYCGYPGGSVSNGSCGYTSCSAKVCATPTPTPTSTPIPTATPTPTPTPTPVPTATPTPIPARNSAGVVSTGRILGFLGNISSKMSVPQWQVAHESEVLSAPIYDYNYFSQRLTGCTAFAKTWNYGQMKKLNGCYTVPAGDQVLDQTDIDLDPNEKVILVVDGNVTVDRQITVPVSSFFAIIASGDITFGPDVGVSSPGGTGVLIQGVFIANGTINTSSGNSGHGKFVGQGMFIADANLDGVGGFNLQRTLGDSGNPYYPAEYFEYRPDFLVNFSGAFGVRRISWKEVAP